MATSTLPAVVTAERPPVVVAPRARACGCRDRARPRVRACARVDVPSLEEEAEEAEGAEEAEEAEGPGERDGATTGRQE